MTETISAVVLTGLSGFTEWPGLTGSDDSTFGRAVIGLALALFVAVAARRARALDWSGVAAAVVCGTACAAAGWMWAATLIGYFIASSLVSRLGRRSKEQRTASVVAKGGARDAAQVLANGGIYSAAAVAMLLWPAQIWAWGGLAALAASAADTWATEIGLLAGWPPRDIIGRTYVLHGISGGVTLPGIGGALLGAAVVALIGLAAGFPSGAAFAAIASGWSGAMIDSLLGSTIQHRRRCDDCAEDTELTVHVCGSATRHIAGIRWVDNDVINLLATLAGFILSAALYLVAVGLVVRSAGAR
ncbi:MAG: DUF92 domain-containing protein [Gemmatimonadaceae bacterium]